MNMRELHRLEDIENRLITLEALADIHAEQLMRTLSKREPEVIIAELLRSLSYDALAEAKKLLNEAEAQRLLDKENAPQNADTLVGSKCNKPTESIAEKAEKVKHVLAPPSPMVKNHVKNRFVPKIPMPPEAELANRKAAGEGIADIAEAYGVSKSTAQRWLAKLPNLPALPQDTGLAQ